MTRQSLALALAVALCGLVAGPALAQDAAKPKSKTPEVSPTVTVMVTNSRKTDLVELQAAESGSASWKKVLGALKAGKQASAKVPQASTAASTCTGPSPTASRWTHPTWMSVRKRRST